MTRAIATAGDERLPLGAINAQERVCFFFLVGLAGRLVDRSPSSDERAACKIQDVAILCSETALEGWPVRETTPEWLALCSGRYFVQHDCW